MTQGYPLEQVTLIKQKRLDEAEKVLREKKELLKKEEEKLLAVEKERDEIKVHRLAKLTQLRAHMDEGDPSEKIQPMRVYLKLVDEKLKVHEHKVKEQQKAVEVAKGAVEAARRDLVQKQHAVEKMHLHRKEWDLEQHKVEQQKESNETDEIGSTLHQRRKRKK